ncbi:MAG: hypothetical protein K0Q73_4373 [Paenibacillus sp.]|nr:hypothetical protein [Paenibacillus sp.]
MDERSGRDDPCSTFFCALDAGGMGISEGTETNS